MFLRENRLVDIYRSLSCILPGGTIFRREFGYLRHKQNAQRNSLGQTAAY